MHLDRVKIDLAVREPFDIRGIFSWMAARAIAGMEHATEGSFARTLKMAGGDAWFEVRENDAAAGGVTLSARLSDRADLEPLIALVRKVFDLDAHPEQSDAALASHAELRPLVLRTPGIRVPGAIDPHEMLIRVMIGQQISVAAARTAITKLVHELGEPSGLSANGGGPYLLFPTMEAISEHGASVLRGPCARIEAIVETAAALASGELTLTHEDDRAEQREALLARRGIGPWTADYVAMRVLNHSDIFLPGDSAIRAGARLAGLPDDAKKLAKWAQRVAPWRSYLNSHLWRANTVK